MADPTFEDLEKLGLSAKQVTEVLDLVAKKINITTEGIKALGINGQTAAKVIGTIREAGELFVDVFAEAKIKLDTFYGALTKAGSANFDAVAESLGTVVALTTKFDAFNGLAAASGNAINTMGDGFNQLVERLGGYTQAVVRFKSLGLGELIGTTQEATKAAFANASNAQELEISYMNLQGSVGTLNRVFDEQGKLTNNLQDQVAKYGIQLANTSAITNQNIKDVSRFAVELGAVGFTLDTVANISGKAGVQTNILTAAMTLARGANRSTKDVLDAMKVAYEDLGNAQGPVTDGAQKGLDMFALMSTASTKLGLRFVDTQSYLGKVAEEFKLVGNNTEGATAILGRFSGSLQSTGLTAKQSVDVIQNMVSSMNKLEMGTKALISARSGGPGGLQGAFQVENLLREGKVDKVAEMLENSFKQQAGGRIYTQKEAGDSPQAAAQFMRQRMMLQSGAFGSMAKDDASATRLLEAMAKGPTETAAALKDVMGDATEKVAKQGNELQEKQTDILQEINNSMDRNSIIAQQTLLENARIAFALTGKNATNSEVMQNREKIKQEERYQNSGAILPGGMREVESLTQQQKRQRALAYESGKGAVKTAPGAALEFVKSVIKQPINTAKKIAKDSMTNYKEDKQNRAVRADIDSGERAEARGTKYMSLFRPTQAPQRLRAPVLSATQQQQQQNILQPREINLNVKLAEGLEAEVENTGDRAGSGNAAANNGVFSGGINVQVNK